MFWHYLKIASRNLIKRKFYSFINVLGLAIGMACCLLITLYVMDELSYDKFHENADRIYRIATRVTIMGKESTIASTNDHIAEVVDELPEVQTSVRVRKFEDWLVRHHSEIYKENDIISVDSNFFQVFTFPLIEGDPGTALRNPNSVVLTEEIARKYFNRVQGVIGNTLTVNGELYKVTGVAKTPPRNAHFHFDMIFPYKSIERDVVDWTNVSGKISTYILLHDNASLATVSDNLYKLFLKYHPETNEYLTQGGTNFQIQFLIQPSTDIHLKSNFAFEMETNGSLSYVYILSTIAIFIFLIACINFINLLTSRSIDRAKEIGVRKILGSRRLTLIKQFLAESLMLSFLAMVIAIVLTGIFRIPFNNIAGKELSSILFHDVYLWLAIGVMILVAGLLAGLYPAFYLTRFNSVIILKTKIAGSKSSKKFRNGLVVFQYVVSIGLLACTSFTYQQLEYMRQKDLGINKDNVLIIDNKLGSSSEVFLNRIKSNVQVLSVATSSQSPHSVTNTEGIYLEGEEENILRVKRLYVDDNFLFTMEIKLIEGRNFNPDMASDSTAMVINKAAAKALGLENPINSIVMRGDKDFAIIGITDDFHFQSLQEEIAPLMILLDQGQKTGVIEARINSKNIPNTLFYLKEQWNLTSTEAPFYYTFLDKNFDSLYNTTYQLGSVVAIFAGLAIFIASLGLLALAAFTAEQRTKEIGIRKVVGASVKEIVMMLSSDFTKLVLIAFFIAIPLSYFAMSLWLQDFAYRIDINLWTFIVAGLFTIVISWLTISFQIIRAAKTNPVDNLNYE